MGVGLIYTFNLKRSKLKILVSLGGSVAEWLGL